MKRKTREFIQHLHHELDDEDENGDAEKLFDESLSLVGLVVMYFNRLEAAVNAAICESISDRSDSTGLLVIHGMQYSAKVDLYKRLCDDLHSCVIEKAPSYENLIDKLKSVGQLRNIVVHADWTSADAQGYAFLRLKLSSSGMHQEYVQFTPDAMEKIVFQINDVHEQFDQYLSEREGFNGK
jgi:hypothetical protein